MNFKKYHVSKNLFDKTTITTGKWKSTSGDTTVSVGSYSDYIAVDSDTDYYVTAIVSQPSFYSGVSYDSAKTPISNIELPRNATSGVIHTPANCAYIILNISTNKANEVMLNLGSTPQPYEPYSSEVWHDIPHYIHNTSTDTLTTLPADVYANDTTATVDLKGNMSQSSQPTPQSPIQPSECGDLETTGEHTGQYKIPISSASTTTNIYLGEVETTRKVKKLVLTGEETSYMAIDASKNIFSIRGVFNQAPELLQVGGFCTHYKYNNAISSLAGNMSNGDFVLNKIADNYSFTIRDNSFSDDTDFKQYVQQQYAAGTPVTVWYVLATPTTGIVNEPIRKIGEYADTVSGITIPTITGKDTVDVETSLKPSEVSLAYTGWHDASVKEWDGSEWS